MAFVIRPQSIISTNVVEIKYAFAHISDNGFQRSFMRDIDHATSLHFFRIRRIHTKPMSSNVSKELQHVFFFTLWHCQWASYQIRTITGCACAGNAGNVFPLPRVNDPDVHHGTCMAHVPWPMPGWLTGGFLWSWWRGKRSRHSRCMRSAQFYVSSKRPMCS